MNGQTGRQTDRQTDILTVAMLKPYENGLQRAAHCIQKRDGIAILSIRRVSDKIPYNNSPPPLMRQNPSTALYFRRHFTGTRATLMYICAIKTYFGNLFGRK